jgi:hypothetical protein
MPKVEESSVVLQWAGDSATSPPMAAPPAFEDIAGHITVDFSRGDESVLQGAEEPPPFSPYIAESQESGNQIISHDPHLNDDGA